MAHMASVSDSYSQASASTTGAHTCPGHLKENRSPIGGKLQTNRLSSLIAVSSALSVHPSPQERIEKAECRVV